PGVLVECGVRARSVGAGRPDRGAGQPTGAVDWHRPDDGRRGDVARGARGRPADLRRVAPRPAATGAPLTEPRTDASASAAGHPDWTANGARVPPIGPTPRAPGRAGRARLARCHRRASRLDAAVVAVAEPRRAHTIPPPRAPVLGSASASRGAGDRGGTAADD